jgi:hypothetical protein
MPNTSDATEIDWDEELAALLVDLSEVQRQTLDYLTEKRELLAKGNTEELIGNQAREARLIEQLQSCHQRRGQLLNRAASAGRPAQNLHRLSTSLDESQRRRISPILTKASQQARLLHHHSLTNWVLAQRSLIHVSHLIEILATGGKPLPTYGRGGSDTGSGGLVDREA